MKKIIISITVLLVIITGCSKNKQADKEINYYSDRVGVSNEVSKLGLGKNDASLTAPEEKELKIVFGGSLDLESREYDKAVETLYQYADRYKMIIEKMEESYSGVNRNLYVTLRIPSGSFAEFMKEASNIGKVNHSSTNRSDFTKAYNDNSIEIEALEVQKERLMTMLKEADTIEEMLLVSDRLTQVETSLNKLRSRNDTIDMDVEYSSITLTLRERGESTVKTASFWERLKETVSDSFHNLTTNLEGFVFWLIYALPYLLIVGLLAILFIKKITPVIKKRKEAKNLKENN